MPRLVPNLWFDDQALEAAEFYVKVFPNSEVQTVTRYTEAGPGEPGTVLTWASCSTGRRSPASAAGPPSSSPRPSLLIECKDQAEIDGYWDALLADGARRASAAGSRTSSASRGRSSPSAGEQVFNSTTLEAVARATKAMLGMVKLDIAELQRAFDGD